MYIGTIDNLIVNHDLFLVCKYILYSYTKYTKPSGYSLSVDRTISDTRMLNFQDYTGLTDFCKYVRVLSIHYAQASDFPGLYRFPYFHKCGRILNIRRDAIKEGF